MNSHESIILIDEEPEQGDKRWNFESSDPKEMLFKHMVEGQIMDEYEDDFKSLGVSQKSLDNLEDALIDESFDERDREIFFCVPYELRLVQFKYALPPIDSGEVISTTEWVEFVKDIVEINKDSDPHLGFHVSPLEVSKIKKQSPKKPLDGQRESWDIAGTEFDDRDEKKMAYYSLSIAKLFTKKGLKNIYVVRANLAKGHNNYPDNNGHWGRASSLSIIMKLDLKGRNLNEVLKEMQDKIEDIEN